MPDPLLLVLSVLLVFTLAAFFAGWLPYPFGWLVLSLLVAARLTHLKALRAKRDRAPTR